MAQNSLILQQFLHSFRNSALDAARFSSIKMVEEIRLRQKLIDEKLMFDVVNYFPTLRSEMYSAREKLILNSADCSRRER